MDRDEATMDSQSLKKLPTGKLDELMSKVLREMRRRDSKHVQGAVGESVLALRKLRASGKLH